MNAFPLRKLFCASALALLLASPAQAQFFTTNFDSASELSSYNLYKSGAAAGTPPTSPSAAGQLTFSETAGLLGGGGLVHTSGGDTDLAAVYQPSVFDLSSPTALTISGFFKTPSPASTGGAGAVFQIGFSANNTTAMYGEAGNSFISSRVNKTGAAGSTAFRLQSQAKVSGGSASTPSLGAADFNLAGDTWYKLSLTVSPSATPNVFDFSTSLENWGPTGEAFVSVVSAPAAGVMTNAELYNDSTTYAAFRAVEGRSNVALDRFSVVPEPSSALLFASMATVMLARRRRQRSA